MVYKIHPITFERYISIEKSAYDELIKKIKNFRVKQTGVEGLKKFNDFVYENIIENGLWESIPSDTGFPGYFSSLAEHAVATTSIAVPIAVEVFKKGFDFASEYDNKEIKNVLGTEKGVIEISRTLSLLHDIGKHPPENHYLRTREYVEKILKRVGLVALSETLAESASRHHYRYNRCTIDEKWHPHTKLEWIVAFADKISSTQERGISGEFEKLLEPYRWLLRLENEGENAERIKKIVEFIECIDSQKDIKNYFSDNTVYTSIPINFAEIKKMDEKIFSASDIINNAKVGVLCIEVAGIHKFVTASDYKKYISGASALIDDAINEAKIEIEKMLSPECVVYAKGGSLLAIIPPSYFERIKEKVCHVFKERTRVVSLKLPKNVEFELWELKYGPRVYGIDDADIKKLLKLAKKRNFGSVVSSVIDSLETAEEIGSPEIIRVGEVCPVCHEYKRSQYEHLIDDKKERVCERCHLALEEDRELRGGEIYIINLEKAQPEVEILLELKPDVSYTRIIKKVKDVFENKLKNSPVVSELKGVKRICFVPVKTWDCLGRQHLGKDYSENCDEVYDIAFIKGDGDNFGKIKGSMSSITLYRQISKMFETVIEDTIAEALSEVMIKQLEIRIKRDVRDNLILELPFDIVFVGGDDFLVLIDAAFIFVFLLAFRNKLQKMLGERKSEFDKKENEPLSIIPLGVSMGIAVVKNRMPIKSILDTLEELLRKSKQRSKSEANRFGGEIFVSMKKFESIPTKDEVKRVFDGTVKYTQFPMNGRELVDFVKDLKFFAQKFAQKEVSPNWIESVFGNMGEMYDVYRSEPNQMKKSPLDFYVNLLYRMARTDKEAKEWKLLERIERMHRDELEHFKEKFVFKHIDIAESLRIVAGRLSLEGLPVEKTVIIVTKLLGE